MITILILIGVILVITVGLDLFQYLYRILLRRGMGNWDSREEWEKGTFKRAEIWSQRMPTVRVTDNCRYIILDIILRKYKNSTIQSWQQAMIDYAILEDYSKKELNAKINKIIKKYIDRKGNWITEIKEIDIALLAYVILKFSLDKFEVKKAMDEVWQLILSRKKEDGLLCYRLSAGDLRFVDTIGLVCPFLTLYANIYKNEEAEYLANNLIKEYLKYGFVNSQCIPAHAYDTKFKLPQGIIGWGRGLAWFLLGLVERYKSLDQKEKIEDLLITIANTIKTYQRNDGGVGWIIVRKETYDSSITAMYAYFFAVCYRVTKNVEYKEISESAINVLKKSTRKNGAIDYSQGDTKGLGMYSGIFDILPFTQGIALLAINELKENEK